MASFREKVKRIIDGDFDDVTEEHREEAIRETIQVCSISAGAVASQPIPFVDTAIITPIQIALVQAIGRIHGYKLDKKSVIEILSTFGASLVAQNAIMAAAKLIPFLGWLVSISVAYALTYAVGDVSDYYFRNGRGVEPGELKMMFKRVYKDKRKEKETEHKKNASLKDKLSQLKDAYKSGLLTEAEYIQKKEDLLAGF